ncbi:EamA family transporter [Nocardioides sp. GXQ0305]|uniref:EamA family transporter n=1 Tax=Nocardioides sp. GXQ0305 TaxID=3423912 RepID=UPI003D7D8A1C
MATMTHDAPVLQAPPSRFATGVLFAVVSAFAFGLSGTLAKGLLDAGWTPAAAVTARIVVGALVLLPPGLLALRGRWHLLRANARMLLVYGLVAVAGTQFAYFSAVQHLQVGVALLLEYTAPVLVIGWLWLRHGQRPSPLIGVGCVVAGGGLVLVLDVVTGAGLHPVGVLWALLAMLGVATYFVLSAQEGNGLPLLVLASAGMVVGAVSLLALGAVGLLEMTWSTAPATYGGTEVPWWAAAVALGVVTAALAYVTGIAAGRRLGSRLASFVALTEVLFALAAAWLVLGEVPATVQFAGGVLILVGVVLVKLGEPRGR